MDASCAERLSRRGLRPAQRRIVHALAEALLSDADDRGRVTPPQRAWLDQVVEEFDCMVGSGSPDIRRGLSALTLAIDTMPALVLRTARRMSQLPLAERVGYLEALENSRIGLLGTLLIAFKLPLMMIAYDRPEGLAHTGLERPDLSKPRGNAPIPQPQGTVQRPRQEALR